MSIFTGLEEIIKTNEPLAQYTWYGLGGAAEYFITPRNTEELTEVVNRCTDNKLDIHVLGYGSNLLISDDGVKGAVIKLEGDEFSKYEFDDTLLTAYAGANLNNVVLECVRKGLGGMEALTGIPGSIGGAVKMNAGGAFGDIGSSIESVMLMDKDGVIFEKSKPELEFDYRYSNISAKIIVAANIRLVESDPDQLLNTLKEIWIYKKNSQPLNTKNAGCIFKNPRGLSAGALIDRAGLKGLQIGAAQVSDKHANFIVANQGCKSADVIRLVESIQQRVAEEFDVNLELELEIW